jgi:hypothetical protein
MVEKLVVAGMSENCDFFVSKFTTRLLGIFHFNFDKMTTRNQAVSDARFGSINDGDRRIAEDIAALSSSHSRNILNWNSEGTQNFEKFS